MEEYKCPGCQGMNYTSITFGKVFCANCGKKLVLENGKCKLAGRERTENKKKASQLNNDPASFIPYLKLIKNKTD